MPDSGAHGGDSRPAARVFPGEILFEAAGRQARRVADAGDAGAVRGRRRALPVSECLHGARDGGADADGDAPVHPNDADFPLEIRNDRAVRLRGIRLLKQPVPSAQRGHADARPNAAGGAVVLPEGGRRLQRGLLAGDRRRVLSGDSRGENHGGG